MNTVTGTSFENLLQTIYIKQTKIVLKQKQIYENFTS